MCAMLSTPLCFLPNMAKRISRRDVKANDSFVKCHLQSAFKEEIPSLHIFERDQQVGLPLYKWGVDRLAFHRIDQRASWIPYPSNQSLYKSNPCTFFVLVLCIHSVITPWIILYIKPIKVLTHWWFLSHFLWVSPCPKQDECLVSACPDWYICQLQIQTHCLTLSVMVG